MKNPSKFEWTMIVILLAILLAIPADAGAQARRTNSGNRGTPAIVPGNPTNQATGWPRTSRSGEYSDSLPTCGQGVSGACINRTVEEHNAATHRNGEDPNNTNGDSGRGTPESDTEPDTDDPPVRRAAN